MIVYNDQNGAYGPIVGQTPEGFPIHLYTDPISRFRTYVVVSPNGQAFYSNERGQIVSSSSGSTRVDSEVTGAIVTGTLGALAGGPVGAILGAIAGAFIAGKLKKQAA